MYEKVYVHLKCACQSSCDVKCCKANVIRVFTTGLPLSQIKVDIKMEEKKKVEQVLRRWRLTLNFSSYLEPQLLAYSSLYWRNMLVIITQSTLIFRGPILEIILKILFISGCWLSRGLGGRLPRKHWLLALRHVSAHPLGHCQQPLPVSGQRWLVISGGTRALASARDFL